MCCIEHMAYGIWYMDGDGKMLFVTEEPRMLSGATSNSQLCAREQEH